MQINITGWSKLKLRLLLTLLIIPGFIFSVFLCFKAAYRAFINEAKIIFTETSNGYGSIWDRKIEKEEEVTGV
jgi:hypothetical protein